MNIITISREFGSGGRELGKRLSDALGYDYYDREIISTIAQRQGLDENFVENTLDSSMWHQVPLTFRHSFTGLVSVPSSQTELLTEQRKVIEEIAQLGRNCIIVGRNADIILEELEPLKIFVCADIESRVNRCIERADVDETLDRKEIIKNIKKIDRNRAVSREMISSSKWGDKNSYNLIVNTAGWDIKELTAPLAAFVTGWFERTR